jgi:hypothetical protein
MSAAVTTYLSCVAKGPRNSLQQLLQSLVLSLQNLLVCGPIRGRINS